jgi:hypothetical protein
MCLYICLSSTHKYGMQQYIQVFCVYYCISFLCVEGILPNRDQNCYVITCISY